jgi:hypothetical protein
MNCQKGTTMRRISSSTLATTVAIGILALGVGAVTVTSNLQTAQAEKGCTSQGEVIRSEAQNPNNEPGYGDEVSPLAQAGDVSDFRAAGSKHPSVNCGNSN